MKKEHFYQDLKRQILTLKLAPGASLDEVSLSKEYDISRTPLREIFQRLAGEGYIEIINNRGAMVSSMDYKTVRNFFLTAPMIYASIGRLATENASREQLSELQEAQDKFRGAVSQKNIEGMVFYNDRFHRLIGGIANNPYLQPSYERLLIDHTRISQTFYRPSDDEMIKDLEEAVDHHEAMIEYIAIGDAERMVALTQAHWDLSKAHMERYVYPDPLPIDNIAYNS
ncbi:MAG: GntR family transcriptional regulator [Gammaproteobacteria bacterium]|nr:GntR family transcriptional regulator [Gammaproteobacteria bacterium]